MIKVMNPYWDVNSDLCWTFYVCPEIKANDLVNAF